MGTRRMWLFLLLAAIQYAGVRATTPLACTSLPVATSDCASYLYPDKPSTHCDQLLTGPSDKPCATADKKWLYKDGNVGEWKQLASIVCDAASRVWKATEIAPPGKSHDLKVADNLICAIPPSPPPPAPECSKCGALVAADCKAADGCVKGGGVVASVDSSTQCKQLKCPPGQFFGTNLPPAAVAEVQINCDSPTKWKTAVGNVVVAKAICVQKYECHKKSAVKSECTGPEQEVLEAAGCEAIVQTTITPTCSGGKKLFYKKAGTTAWVATTENTLTCNAKTTGLWKIAGANPVELVKAQEVICADRNPDTTSLCDKHKLKTECDATVNSLVSCTQLPSFSQTTQLSCSPSSIYRYGAGQWAMAAIKCDQATGKWMEAGQEVPLKTNVICATGDPKLKDCKHDELKSACDRTVLTASICVPFDPLPNKGPLVCTGASNQLFSQESAATWKATPISCNQNKGEWEYAASHTQVPLNTKVVCAAQDPNLKLCTPDKALKTDCASLTGGGKDCSVVASFPDNAPLGCDSPKMLFYYDQAGSVWKRPQTDLQCDQQTGEWMDQTEVVLAQTNVICSKDDITPQVCAAIRLSTDPCTGVDTSLGCEKIPFGDNPSCPSGKTLYFKKDPVATPNTKWMKAESVKCIEAGKWKIEYKFGLKKENDNHVDIKKTVDFADDKDHVICALSNPDPKVCTIGKFEPSNEYFYDETPKRQVEAGDYATCDDTKGYEFYGKSKNYMTMEMGGYPVCQPNGEWFLYTTREGEDVFGGDQIMCRIKKCLTCLNPLKFTAPVTTGDFGESMKSDCLNLQCFGQVSQFIVKTDSAVGTKYRYDSRSIYCNSEGSGWEDSDKKLVVDVSCVQKMVCTDPDSLVIDSDCPLEGTPEGCVKMILPPFDSTPYTPLACPTGKMLIRKRGKDGIPVNPADPYWDEVTSMKCDEAKAQWQVKFADGREDSRDHLNTIVCATANPNPRPTTTTTTTTPAPILPICVVCNRSDILPKGMDGCDKCDGTKIKLTPNSADDECTMNPISKDYKLVINSMEEVAAIVCKRETQQWTKAGGTGEAITKVSARQETKREAWKTLSYVIVAVVFVAIGGMGIICVVIFMRMRKKLSEREGKKKERGVTKKYNASSVVKTKGNKANTKSEAAGKSVEAAKSKTEENLEDAPTLKL